jgi:ribose 1,5-bisphosphokinase PhnN
LTVHVTAEKDILKERLLKRGREKMTDIERRLARAEKKVEARNLLTFDNSHDLEKNCALFSSLLQHVDSRDEMPNKICTFNFI